MIVSRYLCGIFFILSSCSTSDRVEDLFLLRGNETQADILEMMRKEGIDTQSIIKENVTYGIAEEWTFAGNTIYGGPTTYIARLSVRRKQLVNVTVLFEKNNETVFPKLKEDLKKQYSQYDEHANTALAENGETIIFRDSISSIWLMRYQSDTGKFTMVSLTRD